MSDIFKSGDIVNVLLPIAVNEGYDYLIPENINCVEVGNIVLVPLKNKKIFGVVLGRGKSGIDKSKIKSIIQVNDNIDKFNNNLLLFMKKVADWTINPIGNIFSLSIPESKIFESEKFIDILHLSDNYFNIWKQLNRKTEAKNKVIKYLKDIENKNITLSELSNTSNVSVSTIKDMIKIGLLKVTKIKNILTEDNNKLNYNDDLNNIKLSDEQNFAYNKIISNTDKFNVTLIDGITGSGKTEVYFKVIAEILRQDSNKQVLIMLPEISLTTQFLNKFKSRFGIFPTLWHSGLTASKRAKNYLSISKGFAKIIVGTRSALFLPYKNLSFITIDEEHDGSYKQEEGVTYNARDMAVMRAKIENIPIVLASATPSIESHYNVIQNKYDIVKLKKRFSDVKLPIVELIDMKNPENKPKNRNGEKSWFSKYAIKCIENELIDGNQVMIFLNRRGYAPLLICSKCGHKFVCPNCDTSMVVHNVRHDIDENLYGVMKCHRCGYFSSIKKTCPKCHCEKSFILCGPGVDRIKEEIDKYFPTYTSYVISSDTVNTSNKLNNAISSIEKHEIDIIIGTQILSKGHNFPNLTLVVIVDGDMGIAGDDFRGAEKTFAMLHQVSGRAGRYKKRGKVLIQTYNPDMKVMQYLKDNDKQSFVQFELNNRQVAKMPPYSRLCAIIISGKNKETVINFTKYLSKKIPIDKSKTISIWGPVDAPITVLNNYYRRRFLIVVPLDISIQKIIQIWLKDVKIPSSLRFKIDMDPYNFM